MMLTQRQQLKRNHYLGDESEEAAEVQKRRQREQSRRPCKSRRGLCEACAKDIRKHSFQKENQTELTEGGEDGKLCSWCRGMLVGVRESVGGGERKPVQT